MSSATGTLTVLDNYGDSNQDSLTITVIADNPGYRESTNDLSASPNILYRDSAYIPHIQSQGDIDVFELKRPDGTLPVGTQVLVTLRTLPPDCDLALIALPPADALSSSRPASFDIGPFDIGSDEMPDSGSVGYVVS